MRALCLSNFAHYILQLQRISGQFADNECKAISWPKKVAAVLAGRKDVENDGEFLDDSVLSKFKVYGFCRLRVRVFQLLWLFISQVICK